MEELKIESLLGLDVASAPDRLTGSAAENKAIFDALAKGLMIPHFNALIELLQSPDGAGQIGFAAEALDAQTVHQALLDLFRRAYSKQEIDETLAEREAKYTAMRDILAAEVFALLNREQGAPASIAGVAHAGQDIALLEGEGIVITPDKEAKTVKITSTSTSIPVPHAREHEQGGVDALTAEIAFDNSGTVLAGETVQEALGELSQGLVDLSQDLVALVPRGMIMMWSGAADAVPAGWHLCDGQEGTPNLLDRFIIGAGSKYSLGARGGSETVALTAQQMPSHKHTFSGSIGTVAAHTHTEGAAGLHDHDTYITGSGNASIGGKTALLNSYNVFNESSWDSFKRTIAPMVYKNGDHTHAIASSGEHTHTVSGTIANTGSGQAHENLPPYYALCYVMKL